MNSVIRLLGSDPQSLPPSLPPTKKSEIKNIFETKGKKKKKNVGKIKAVMHEPQSDSSDKILRFSI